MDILSHIEELKKVENKRIRLFDLLELPKGWVVTSNPSTSFWEKCRTLAIPMKPTRLWGVFSTPATREFTHWKFKYGNDLLVVLIPDDEVEVGYSGGPIFIEDLERNPWELLDESVRLFQVDPILSEAKRREAMLLKGWTDTK